MVLRKEGFRFYLHQTCFLKHLHFLNGYYTLVCDLNMINIVNVAPESNIPSWASEWLENPESWVQFNVDFGNFGNSESDLSKSNVALYSPLVIMRISIMYSVCIHQKKVCFYKKHKALGRYKDQLISFVRHVC